MKKIVLSLFLLLFFTACETGTKYKESDKSTGKVEHIKVADKTISELIGTTEVDDSIKDEVSEIKHFEGGVMSDGLNIKAIRKGMHSDYLRLVFDVSKELGYTDTIEGESVSEVGYYNANYNSEQKVISVVLNGYRKFSAPLPQFSSNSIIEKIYFDHYPDDSGYKFYIKLRKSTDVKIFDLKNPARMVFDIRAI